MTCADIVVLESNILKLEMKSVPFSAVASTASVFPIYVKTGLQWVDTFRGCVIPIKQKQ